MKNNLPLISVVLPVYNCGSYISEAIESILSQTISDFELLIIDDASQDDTVSQVEAFEDKRIRLIKKTVNKGLIDSLNLGFSLAKGKYIARMDGDDISLRNRFEKQLAILENNQDIKAVGCWLQFFGNENKVLKHFEYHSQIQAQLLNSCPMSLGSVLLEKEAFKKFKFDKDKLHVEDYDFWSRSAWECEFYNIPEFLYLYRVHGNQVSSKYRKIQLAGSIKIKLELYKKLSYNCEKFPDHLLIRLFFKKEIKNALDFKFLEKWFRTLLKKNSKDRVFENTEFKKHIKQVRKMIIYHIFFLNPDSRISFNQRLKILSMLKWDEINFVLRRKFRKRTRSLKE
ncbi:Glycosyltransferase involved in cell wall bisynthesis [Salegentibacter echinorum]|uniref:Glycosyltransferase involved in cell wall bisynthesis n=1 Tax=Salegentibacter echinorum TaxID=1073325 RepID=A0A1M5JV11_SALEC|nr:glycosyltransferase family 2 protein [Salegentibacter echinorum]SHG44384.1 Glycosyltransferase involved in cell wall bisynthesis [Salegentibacter echinorum]